MKNKFLKRILVLFMAAVLVLGNAVILPNTVFAEDKGDSDGFINNLEPPEGSTTEETPAEEPKECSGKHEEEYKRDDEGHEVFCKVCGKTLKEKVEHFKTTISKEYITEEATCKYAEEPVMSEIKITCVCSATKILEEKEYKPCTAKGFAVDGKKLCQWCGKAVETPKPPKDENEDKRTQTEIAADALNREIERFIRNTREDNKFSNEWVNNVGKFHERYANIKAKDEKAAERVKYIKELCNLEAKYIDEVLRVKVEELYEMSPYSAEKSEEISDKYSELQGLFERLDWNDLEENEQKLLDEQKAAFEEINMNKIKAAYNKIHEVLIIENPGYDDKEIIKEAYQLYADLNDTEKNWIESDHSGRIISYYKNVEDAEAFEKKYENFMATGKFEMPAENVEPEPEQEEQTEQEPENEVPDESESEPETESDAAAAKLPFGIINTTAESSTEDDANPELEGENSQPEIDVPGDNEAEPEEELTSDDVPEATEEPVSNEPVEDIPVIAEVSVDEEFVKENLTEARKMTEEYAALSEEVKCFISEEAKANVEAVTEEIAAIDKRSKTIKLIIIVVGAVLIAGAVTLVIISAQKSTKKRGKAAMAYVYGSSILGCRESQQDAYGAAKKENGEVFAVLCDGMGGLSSGDAASRICVETVQEMFVDTERIDNYSEFFKRAAQKADVKIHAYGEKYCGGSRIGTTMISAIVENGKLHWASVGDSRIYFYRNGELSQVTRDHNYRLSLEQEVAAGRMTREQMERHPEKNALISYVGMNGIRLIDAPANGLALQKDDVILLCSDGLYKALSNGEIRNIIAESKGKAKYLPETLTAAAFDKGLRKQDNTTVVVIKI